MKSVSSKNPITEECRWLGTAKSPQPSCSFERRFESRCLSSTLHSGSLLLRALHSRARFLNSPSPCPGAKLFIFQYPYERAVEMTATTLSPREMKRLRKQGADYVSPSPYTVRAAFRRGDLFTKLSAVVFGLGDIVRKQYVKGIAMLALEIAYFVFMAINGVDYLPSCRPWAPMQAARSWSTASGSTPNLTVPWSSCCTVSPLWLSPLPSSACGSCPCALHTSPRCCSRRTARLRASWTMSASCSMPRLTSC